MTLATGTRPAVADTIGFANVLRSELTKLRSVRSTWWTTAAAALATVAVCVIICVQWRNNLISGKDSLDGFDATLTSLNGLYLAQVAVGTLGVLVMSSEYGTGMIRATMAAVPQRRTVLAAKGLVFAGCTFVAAEILSFAGFAIGQAILSGAHASASLGDPGVLRATVGGGLYLTAVGLLGFGLGALVRHTAGALSAFFGVLFASTALVDLLPTTWRNEIIDYLPANAGSQILTTVPTDSALGPWAGLVVLTAYGAAAVLTAALLITRRDV
jgi:ABC-type transport system involved in multi-copper enzyme maturation permease subunit